MQDQQTDTALVNTLRGQALKFTATLGVLDLFEPGDDAAVFAGVALSGASAGGPLAWAPRLSLTRVPVLMDGDDTLSPADPISLPATVAGCFTADDSNTIATARSSAPASAALVDAFFAASGGGSGGGSLQSAYDGGNTVDVAGGAIELDDDDVRTTITPTIRHKNNTAATAPIPEQNAPAMEWAGSVWDSGLAAAQAFTAKLTARAVTGDPGLVALVFGAVIGGGSYIEQLYLDTAGIMRRLLASGLTLQGGTTPGDNVGAIELSDTVGAEMRYRDAYYRTYGNYTAEVSNAADGDGNECFSSAPATNISDVGKSVQKISGGPGDPGRFLHMASAVGVYGDGDYFTASATATVNKLVAWSGGSQVAKPAATGGLTTIAGVALATVASGLVKCITRGPVLVDCDAGTLAGDLLVSSDAVAGNVKTDNAAAAGAIVGKAMEDRGATVAGKVKAYVGLG